MPEFADTDYLCHCLGLKAGELRQHIRSEIAKNGDCTVADLQHGTGACTGCGCCRWDCHDLLREAGIPARDHPDDDPVPPLASSTE